MASYKVITSLNFSKSICKKNNRSLLLHLSSYLAFIWTLIKIGLPIYYHPLSIIARRCAQSLTVSSSLVVFVDCNDVHLHTTPLHYV